jgi:hypothetical protein
MSCSFVSESFILFDILPESFAQLSEAGALRALSTRAVSSGCSPGAVSERRDGMDAMNSDADRYSGIRLIFMAFLGMDIGFKWKFRSGELI